MADHSRQVRSERADAAKPWPLLVALGLVGSEVGLVVGLLPVAVAGLVVFAASVAGILTDAEYVDRPGRLAAGFGAAFVVIGAVLAAHGTGTLPIGLLEPLSGLTSRGVALVGAGVVTMAGATVLRFRRARDER
ncbi:hypothetical protein [Natrinema sp. 1APR25-10V2]|uniref:DUF7541 family protein n=1 Tax=Natrinema sp. 1APR25-10V2 TaxID=2951081 RepID=UPI002874BC6D|nr:hypothetical protein [Natrinema sp. 1APR25-10V2]MDS0474298.1 hypothetical protein [Natrinema sp. 1APR25-10V2]